MTENAPHPSPLFLLSLPQTLPLLCPIRIRPKHANHVRTPRLMHRYMALLAHHPSTLCRLRVLAQQWRQEQGQGQARLNPHHERRPCNSSANLNPNHHHPQYHPALQVLTYPRQRPLGPSAPSVPYLPVLAWARAPAPAEAVEAVSYARRDTVESTVMAKSRSLRNHHRRKRARLPSYAPSIQAWAS